ncbi:beta-N-acetylhexosaminidase, beta subunit [Entamoeba histolytica]
MIVLLLLISYCFAGNGVNVKNQLLLMPYPTTVNAQFGSNDCVEATSNIKMVLSNNCQNDPNCLSFMTFNFNHTITYPLQRQRNLEDFRVSIFAPIDIEEMKGNVVYSANTVNIELTGNNIEEIYPPLKIGIDESYSLDVTKEGIKISATTVYGARLGLETLIQMLRPYQGKYIIKHIPIMIEDKPRLQWRGLMIDVARNSFSRSAFVKIINAMAAIKANVLHIHLSDAQTFMFELKEYPELSKKGAFFQNKVLTQSFIKQLVQYGAKRGVIVYPEIDTPAHTASWNAGYPGVVADIWDYIVSSSMRYGENVLALNPANEKTFSIIDALMKEMGEVFGNDYVHFGGDEVWTGAWSKAKEYPAILEWMNKKGINTLKELEAYFNKYAQEQIIKNGKTPVCWEEVYQKGSADKKTIIQVWNNVNLLKEAATAGYKVILSAGYYLDMQMPLCSDYVADSCTNPNHMWVWTNRDMYRNDPIKELDYATKQNVLGGEACSWDESVDEQNFFDRVFQRFSAVAERFWSSEDITDPESHEVRANYVRCLGLRRNFLKGTGPLYHSYCQLPEDI